MNVSKTMKVLDNIKQDVKYVVIKIGKEVYSTTFTDLKGKDIEKAYIQITDTEGIGIQKNLRIKGKLSEATKHKKMDKLPFEINIYSAYEPKFVTGLEFENDNKRA